MIVLKVNNAGILAMGSIENATLESFDEVMNVNVRWVLCNCYTLYVDIDWYNWFCCTLNQKHQSTLTQADCD